MFAPGNTHLKISLQRNAQTTTTTMLSLFMLQKS
jgi:hypothetical protein